MCNRRLNRYGCLSLLTLFLIISGFLASLYMLETTEARTVTVYGQSIDANLFKRTCEKCVRTNQTRECHNVWYYCFYVRVDYQYVYNHQHYRNQVEVGFGTNRSLATTYYRMVSVTGTEVMVYLDSADPANSSLLKSGLDNGWRMAVWAYIIVFGVGVIICIFLGMIPHGLSFFLAPRNNDGG